VSTLDVSYSTKDYPVSVVVDLVMFPDVTDLTVTNAFHYEYGVQADGQGAMKFSVTGNFITTTPAIETLTITSRWLASGAGRATATIAEGDGMGMTQTECWDDSFNATYNDKPWAMGENTGSVSACPAIPGL
jgi:hypothetical protein